MHRFFKPAIRPLLEATKPSLVVEIGSDWGHGTELLATWCHANGAALHIVDPLPKYDVDEWAQRWPGSVTFHLDLSLNALVDLDAPDMVCIDGDHNWYTVYHELELLARSASEAGRPFPLTLFHDVAWPYGRRDLYYDPATIPEAHRHPYRKGGLVPGQRALTESGFNDHLDNALHEGTLRNGVRTAVEDFVADRPHLALHVVPGLHGLGIVVDDAADAAVHEAIADVTGPSGLMRVIEAVEEDRLARLQRLSEMQKELVQERERAGRTRAEAAHHAERAEALAAQVSALGENLAEARAQAAELETLLTRTRLRVRKEKRLAARRQRALDKKVRALDRSQRSLATVRSRLDAAEAESRALKRRLGAAEADYSRLRNRRSVRLTLRMASLFRPLFRLRRGQGSRKTSTPATSARDDGAKEGKPGSRPPAGATAPADPAPVRLTPSTAAAAQPSPEAAGRRRPRRIRSPRAARAGRALWAGFGGIASAELDKLVQARHDSPAEASRAALELARWWRYHGDLDRALDLARLSRAARPDAPWSRDGQFLEADVLHELGLAEEGRYLLDHMLEGAPDDPHLLLRLANTFASPAGPAGDRDDLTRLAIINQVLANAGLSSLRLADAGRGLRIDNLAGTGPEPVPHQGPEPLVSVVVPAFNASDWLATSVGSILAQTWPRIEVVIVDDASSDGTVEVAQELAARDRRVRVLRQSTNRGAYAARNRGVASATGDFVTVNDSDDWSHPERIAREVRALVDDPDIVGVMPHRSRVTADLVFIEPTVRSRPERVIPDISSLMVRRATLEEVGPWDEVRAAGDHEFGKRLEAYYGPEAVLRIHPEAPMSLSLRLPESISAAGATSILSRHHVIGARRLYHQALAHWHDSPSFRESLPFRPGEPRPFPAPRPITDGDPGGTRTRPDLVFLSDFTPSGATAAAVEELAAQSSAGLTTALVHNPSYHGRFLDPISARVWDAAGSTALLLGKDERIDTDLLVIRDPWIAEHFVDGLPTVTAARTIVVINRPPHRSSGRPVPDLDTVIRNVRARYGDQVVWYPGDPSLRRSLEELRTGAAGGIRLAAEDWADVIDVDAWRGPLRRVDGPTVRVGLSRRGAQPERQVGLPDLSAHLHHGDVTIHTLGEAEFGGGSLPGAGPVDDADPVRDFLDGLDIYVHLDASTGTTDRTLLAALAVGIPIVTGTGLAPLLGPAAVYAAPEDVLDAIFDLRDDPRRYEAQVRSGWRLVEERFSHQAHIERLGELRAGITLL